MSHFNVFVLIVFVISHSSVKAEKSFSEYVAHDVQTLYNDISKELAAQYNITVQEISTPEFETEQSYQDPSDLYEDLISMYERNAANSLGRFSTQTQTIVTTARQQFDELESIKALKQAAPNDAATNITIDNNRDFFLATLQDQRNMLRQGIAQIINDTQDQINQYRYQQIDDYILKLAQQAGSAQLIYPAQITKNFAEKAQTITTSLWGSFIANAQKTISTEADKAINTITRDLDTQFATPIKKEAKKYLP